MKLNNLNILAFAACTSASHLLIKNYCNEDVYATLYQQSTQETNGPFVLPGGQAYLNNIIATGNTATITKSADVFSAIPKLVVGYSTDQGILYWTLYSETGDPFVNEEFNVTSAFSNGQAPNVCQNATSYGNQVHACRDTDVTLTLDLC